jgi:prolipoprotein diacylglyceryl transferase
MAFVWDIRPEVFSFSPLPRWYSLIFASGIVGGYAVIRKMFIREGKSLEILDSLLVYVVVGMMAGMRLGHCLFYQPDYYFAHPLEIPMIWKGGYASHGGFAGVIIALALFARKHRELSMLWLLDRVSTISMFTAGCIRVGNFFNSEMIGHEFHGAWAVVFAQIDALPRHPAQLYEAVGYFAIFLISWALYYKTDIATKPGRLIGINMFGGFFWRFLCEFFKEDQVPFEQGMTLNMGQLLSIPFVLIGLGLALGLFTRRKAPEGGREAPAA